MTSALEERLSAALHARADLVQPDTVRHLGLPEPASRPTWRRPVLVALVAAAAVAAIAVPLVQRHTDTDHQPAVHVPLLHEVAQLPTGRFHPPERTLTHRLTGDLDGDGQPDVVQVKGTTLEVTLAADPAHPLRLNERNLRGLVGLADFGGPGQVAVTSVADLGNGVEWQAYGIRNGALKLELVHGGGGRSSVNVVPGYGTSWLTPRGVLMSGILDPMQAGQRHLAVTASRVEGRPGGVPTFVPLGRWCWDVVTQPAPAPCAAGQDNAFDPGPHGSIPPLFPRFDLNDSITTNHSWRDSTVSLHLVEGPVHAQQGFNQVYDLVGTIDGHQVSAEAGIFIPNVVKTFVDLGHGVRGIVVTSATGDTPLGPGWNLLSYVDGRLTLTDVRSNLGPGTAYGETWVGPGGRVFMRVPRRTVGHFELYRWQASDSSGTAVVPVDLGTVCIDDFEGTYGTCRS